MTRNHLWLASLFIATLSLGTDEFVIAGVLTPVAADLEISTGAAGQLVTAFALAFALGAPVLAVWLDRHPRRPVLCGGLAIFALANLGCAAVDDFPALLALRILAGLSAAAVSTSAFAIAAAGAPRGRQGTYLSVVTAGLTVALFTGVPIGAWIADVFNWRATFVLIAVVAAAAALTAFSTLPPLPGAAPAPLSERLAPLRHPSVLRMVAAIFLCGTGGLMFYTYLGPITERTTGSDEHLPLLLLLTGLVGVGAALGGGRLSDRFGPRRSRVIVITGHAAALAVLALLAGYGAPIWAFAAIVAVWSLFAWALNPPMQASTIAAAPDAPMTAVSLNITGLYAGTAIAGALGGLALDHLGPQAIPVIGALALAAAGVIASPATRPGRLVGSRA
ncbi:MFS transporter [Glycomyces buryatensis]|uniref:MFS transporter n=1 Tax=Glycomyces buryatensis TaxID=2570927 RepID=A0A4S8QE28_9ACTN|nr:MFS transporter [Glycomyces buryatensis]THV39429.1 MFS transporter [Glycomyces buryatensis]